jgi:hypothetical protein
MDAWEIEAKMTTHGGWNKRQLATWGVPWPPPRGWKQWALEASRGQSAPQWAKVPCPECEAEPGQFCSTILGPAYAASHAARGALAAEWADWNAE